MFSSKCNFQKLKTNLRLTVNRLKLLEKKKTELALKSRKEIADYIQAGKEDRARIRVEHIVREDYMVEGMEILEMFCDLLLARFGIIERVSAVDPTVEEAIASIIWAEPRLSADIPELTVISKNLLARYGKEYHAACKSNQLNAVNEKLMRKMSIYSPPKSLIENYMVEIAKSFNVDFEPDQLVLLGEDGSLPIGDLLEFGEAKKFVRPPSPPGGGMGPPPPSGGGGGGYPSGGGGYPSGGGGYPSGGGGYPSGGGGYPNGGGRMGPPPPSGGGGGYPSGAYPPTTAPFGYPPNGPDAGNVYPPPLPSVPPSGPVSSPQSPGGFNIPPELPSQPANHQIPPTYNEAPQVPPNPPNYSSLNIRNNLSHEPDGEIPSLPEIPGDDFNLPSVPSSVNPTGPSGAGGPSSPGQQGPNDIDFDDLAARFDKLKKRK